MEKACVDNVCGSPLQEMVPNFCPLPLLHFFLCTKILTFIARLVSAIVCRTNKGSRSEMLSNRQTDRETHTHTDPTTVTPAAHAR